MSQRPPPRQRRSRRSRARTNHRFHPFVYATQPRAKDRNPRCFHLRDVAAQAELADRLGILGGHYGELILNFPPPDGSSSPRRATIDLSGVAPGDLIVQTTRPPLHDGRQGARKQLARGGTDLEDHLFRVWEQYFWICSRNQISLSDAITESLRPGERDGMRFSQWQCARMREVKPVGGGWRRQTGLHRTAAFLLRLDEAWPGGPGYLGAFGLDGTATLLWASRLRHDQWQLLDHRGLTIVDMDIHSIPRRPVDLRWARDTRIEVVLRCDPFPAPRFGQR